MTVKEFAAGNPGALSFLIGLGTIVDPADAIPIAMKIEKNEIKGSDLWILYSDLGEKDYKKVRRICENVPDDILKDACSRQDRSGVALINPYIKV